MYCSFGEAYLIVWRRRDHTGGGGQRRYCGNMKMVLVGGADWSILNCPA